MRLLKPKRTTVIETKKIPTAALEILENGYFAYLATCEPDCTPHLTPMFFIWEYKTHTIYLITSKSSRKVANIRRNPRVSLTVDFRDPVSPSQNRGILIKGRAKLLEKVLVDAQILHEYNKKHMHLLGADYPLESDIVIQIQVSSISYWHGIRFYKWLHPSKKKARKE